MQSEALLFCLNLFQFPLRVSNRVTTHHQQTVTVYAASGIYHASALTNCWHNARSKEWKILQEVCLSY